MNEDLRLQLSEDDADAERLDALTGFLRQELLQLDVVDVRTVPAGAAPQGARGFEVVEFNGNPECKFVLRDAADGQQLDFGSARSGGGPVLLDPAGRSPVYVANPHCGVRISSG